MRGGSCQDPEGPLVKGFSLQRAFLCQEPEPSLRALWASSSSIPTWWLFVRAGALFPWEGPLPGPDCSVTSRLSRCFHYMQTWGCCLFSREPANRFLSLHVTAARALEGRALQPKAFPQQPGEEGSPWCCISKTTPLRTRQGRVPRGAACLCTGRVCVHSAVHGPQLQPPGAVHGSVHGPQLQPHDTYCAWCCAWPLTTISRRCP